MSTSGSDMNAVFLDFNPALARFVSFPFTLGHENVGVIAEVGQEVEGFSPGDRVVADPLLPCATRGIEPPCEFCQRGEFSLCQNFAEGDLSPGFGIGTCRDTGGSSGARVTYKATVEEILVEESPLPDVGRGRGRGSRAVGVRLADGSEHRADVVISAADGYSTIFKMLGGRYVNDKIEHRYKNWKLIRPLVMISFGVAREFTGEPQRSSPFRWP